MDSIQHSREKFGHLRCLKEPGLDYIGFTIQ